MPFRELISSARTYSHTLFWVQLSSSQYSYACYSTEAVNKCICLYYSNISVTFSTSTQIGKLLTLFPVFQSSLIVSIFYSGLTPLFLFTGTEYTLGSGRGHILKVLSLPVLSLLFWSINPLDSSTLNTVMLATAQCCEQVGLSAPLQNFFCAP